MARDEQLYEAIKKGDRAKVRQIVKGAVERGEDAAALLDEAMIPAMREMGDKFSRGEIFVPEMLISARAMQTGLQVIEPLFEGASVRHRGVVCVGTVKGDLHDIGKNLVSMMLRGAGYEVDDIGVNCDVAKFEKSVEAGAKVVCCSALITTTMPYMKEVVSHLKSRHKDVKVVIGGAPVTEDYARLIGADGFGGGASDVVKVVDAFFKEQRA